QKREISDLVSEQKRSCPAPCPSEERLRTLKESRGVSPGDKQGTGGGNPALRLRLQFLKIPLTPKGGVGLVTSQGPEAQPAALTTRRCSMPSGRCSPSTPRARGRKSPCPGY